MATVSAPPLPPSVLLHLPELNFSSCPCPSIQTLNATTLPPPINPPSLGMSCFTMTLGGLSNLTALGILAKSYVRFRHRAKAPFLLLVGALLLTDLAGNLIPGAFALHLHLGLSRRHRVAAGVREPAGVFCQLFGASMVFFGLCPLLLGSAMAVERCVGITQPLLHSALITVTHVRLAVLLLPSLALLLAGLPLVDVGSYTTQFPGTWCFLSVHGPLSTADASLALTFSGLGLIALSLSLICNTLSGLALLQARLSSQGIRTNTTAAPGRYGRTSSSSPLRSLDVEMMAQLTVITMVSCVCWSPFLISISLLVGQFYCGGRGSSHTLRQSERLVLLGLRMASWNQILDPWVYILLRRAVLRRVFRVLQPDTRSTLTQSSSCTTASRRQGIGLN
ncbi:prostaglandin E2 receptor EP1 subtype-like [Coregonus clupeaformis]|uniref:prostaglandin E2 receptor EP1 subtype-like n=1 Tax=Coregonus clupeaformis TaxID=59861 RepID=UPI001BE0BF04|nr:prostaglandin E2 receptor EP1 subtype-like [Coregonus clupeaformis]